MSAAGVRILLCADDAASVNDLSQLLQHAGYASSHHLLGGPEPVDLLAHSVVIVDGSRAPMEALRFCRRLRERLTEGLVPILFVTSDHSPSARLASFEAGADTCLLRPFAAGELLAQVQAFLRIKELHDRLADQTAEVHRMNKRLQLAHQQIDQELELARRIQMSFLPQVLPEIPQMRLAVHYGLCGRVGGDFYDIFRLDEHHVGFYVADAMGHGVPASLLTIFVKKGVHAKEISGQQYRLIPPDQVLQRLNRELIEQGLSENPFITMVYVLYDFRKRTLCFSRAGHPYPLHVPQTGEPRFWQVHGSLLGVFETEFQIQTWELKPGDKVLFYTDGIDTAQFEDHGPGSESLAAAADRFRSLSIQDFVPRLARDLFKEHEQLDDLTLLGLEVTG